MGIIQRPRILRKNHFTRMMVQENTILPSDFIAPLFIVEGSGIQEPISSLPGHDRRSIDMTLNEVETLQEMGILSVLLFCKCADEAKDNTGKEALNPDGLMQRSIRAIKGAFPDMQVFTDVALDPYSSYGHDGIVRDGQIINDETVEVLSKMAVSHAEAGADFVAPSDMMDGRIGAMRAALESGGFVDTGIMSYSAKYASSLYGPFREALDSAPGFGDKKTYQMNPANSRSAIRELLLDCEEGADILMVKPASYYLDIIHKAHEVTNKPIAAYQVSGEYAMIKAAAEKGWIEHDAAMIESVLSIKRAGASLIASYFCKEIIPLIK